MSCQNNRMNRRTGQTHSISSTVARVVRSRLVKWGRVNYQPYPWRQPKLKWHGLIAEVLLQRTRAPSVVPVYKEFVRHFPNLQVLANAPVEEVFRVVRPLGLAWRAPIIKQLGIELSRRRRIPTSEDDLQRLPGIGPYASAAWLSFHAGKRACIVDSNIVRFLCRLTGNRYDGETRRKQWTGDLANMLTPMKNVRSYNFAILDFTMTICTPLQPRCEQCPVGKDICVFGRGYIS
jgi:A/G-specific adenine glycosylase